MVWFAVACAMSAAAHQLWVVPRLPRVQAADGDVPPDYRLLARPRDAVVVAGVATACALAVWPALDGAHLLLWLGYLGGGASLAWIDLRTTWLPRRLHYAVTAAMGVGLLVVLVGDPLTAAGIAVGAVAAQLLFYSAWRLSSQMGFGDVRLAGLVGAASASGGLQSFTAGILAGTALGAVWGVAHALVVRRTGGEPHFPYGPALWLGPVLATAVSG